MKKTASHKSKAKVVSSSRTSSSKKSSGFIGSYVQQRDQFYQDHPNSQLLLGIFIILLTIFIGVTVWGRMKVYNYEISQSLNENVYAAY